MRRNCRIAVLCGLIYTLLGSSYGQESLGDVARKQRQKEKIKETQTSQQSQPAHKVITDEDMPQHPEAAAETSATGSSDKDPEEVPSTSPSPGGESAEGWKTAILAQKTAIASLQSQCDKLSESIHYVQANLYVNGPQYNQYQQQKQQQLQQMQKQLSDQKKKLEDMQEAARKAGFGSTVYDP